METQRTNNHRHVLVLYIPPNIPLVGAVGVSHVVDTFLKNTKAASTKSQHPTWYLGHPALLNANHGNQPAICRH